MIEQFDDLFFFSCDFHVFITPGLMLAILIWHTKVPAGLSMFAVDWWVICHRGKAS